MAQVVVLEECKIHLTFSRTVMYNLLDTQNKKNILRMHDRVKAITAKQFNLRCWFLHEGVEKKEVKESRVF